MRRYNAFSSVEKSEEGWELIGRIKRGMLLGMN